MKKWQRNPWAVPSYIPPYDVVEFDKYGKKIYAHSFRRFEDAWARFQKNLMTSEGWIEFRRLNKVDADMTTVAIHNNKGIENIVEWRNLDKVGKEKV
jgi:hypothetical protein